MTRVAEYVKRLSTKPASIVSVYLVIAILCLGLALGIGHHPHASHMHHSVCLAGEAILLIGRAACQKLIGVGLRCLTRRLFRRRR